MSKNHITVTSGLIFLLAIALSKWDILKYSVTIGGDEAYEVTKARLVSMGYHLYDPIWNNQPPLHTVLLAAMFKVFGVGIIQARIIAIVFGVLYCGSVVAIVNRFTRSAFSSYYTLVIIVLCPLVLRLAVSPMLEIPAFGVAGWSLWIIGKARPEDATRKAVGISGIIFGIAVLIKYTAVIMIPGIIATIFVYCSGKKGWIGFVQMSAIWMACAALVIIIGIIVFKISLEQTVFAMFRVLPEYSLMVNQLGFSILRFRDSWTLLVFGLGFMLLGCCYSRFDKKFLVPIILVLSVFSVHFVRKPFWEYYYIHFAFVLTISLGVGASCVLTFFLNKTSPGEKDFIMQITRLSKTATVMAIIFSAVIIIIPMQLGHALVDEWDIIGSSPRINDTDLVRQMMKYKSKTRFVYTRDPMCVFHAGLSLIPEIAVLPDNRAWSGEIEVDTIWDTIKNVKPEQLLIVEEIPARFVQYVNEKYEMVYHDLNHQLYIARWVLN